jgi:hypothetical protein
MPKVTRNDPLSFGAFAWKNLEFIEQAAKNNPEELHPVTQLALSLLGLIVFQHEKNRVQFNRKVRGIRLDSLNWPQWDVSKPSNTLGQFIKQLRHVVAHGGITFSSNSHILAEVVVLFDDPKSNWTGRINADDLRTFCCRFKALLDGTG